MHELSVETLAVWTRAVESRSGVIDQICAEAKVVGHPHRGRNAVICLNSYGDDGVDS